MTKLSKKSPGQMLETTFIVLHSLESFNLSFLLLFNIISTAILKFLLCSPAMQPWFLKFIVIQPRFPGFPCWFSTSKFPSHSTVILRISLQFPIFAFTDRRFNLYSLRIYVRKIVALVQKGAIAFLLLHNYWHQIIIYTIYDVISVINMISVIKIIYLIVPQLKKL